MTFGVRAFYESSLKVRGWKSCLVGLLLHIPIAIAAVWIFLIVLYLVPWFSTSRMKQKADNSGAVSSPSLRGIEYGLTDRMGKKWSLKADTVTVRDRQYGNAVFTSFKDVVVSHARVFTKVGTPADFLDWANGSNLWLLMGLVLAVPQDKSDDSVFGSRLVIEDLEVYGTDDGKGPRLLLSAEKMTRESVSDEIEFAGRLTIEWDPAKRITCLQTARWLPAQKMMHFPEGCLVNGKNRGMKYWVAGGNTGNAPKQFIAGPSASQVQSAGLSSPSGDRVGPEEIQKLIKKKDPKSLQNILLQYLVLNPRAFKDGGISPMMIMCPNFKLGQFTPGPLARDAN